MSVIYIGSAIGDGGIRGRLEQRVQDPQRYFDPASKQAWRSGLTVEASWAATTNKAEAKRYEAALLRTYRVEHDHLPGITIDGKWIRGNKQTPGQREVPREELHWSEWTALYHIDYTTERSKELFAIIPTSPGVYRFRVAESDHANALARTSVPGSKRAPSQRTSLTIDDAVMDYWHKTGRRTNNARISHLLLCECCKVVFPSGISKNARINQSGHVRCALCKSKRSAGKPCLHP